MRFRYQVLLAALQATVAACGGVGAPPPSAPSPLVRQPAPEFSRPALNGGLIDSRTLRGKVVVIKFFAKYCEPCVRTLPATQSLHSDYGPSVAFVGVAVDERREDVLAMVERFGLSFPIVHDRQGVLAARFRVARLPLTFVVQPDGLVHWVGGGDVTEAGLRGAIESARAP